MTTFMWIIIALIVIVLMVVFKFKEVRHKFGLVIVIFLVVFLVFSIYRVYSTNDVDLQSFDGVVAAGKIYFSWLGNLGHNVADISGYAVKQDWGFKNKTTNSTIGN